MHTLPWDGAAKELGSGRSIQEQLQAIFGKDRVRCARQLSVEDGIAAVRAIFPKCYFDSERCNYIIPSTKQVVGIRGLRCYQYEYDQDLRTWSRKPLHDWASHDADAFRCLATTIREEAKPKAKPAPSTVARGIRYG
jgi:phage terminase large subunit